MNYKEIAERLNKNIKDKKLKGLLFGMEELEAEDIEGIGTVYRLLVFSFMFEFIRYKYNKINGLKLSNTQNSKRVYDAFDKIYETEKVEISLINYVLKEILIDEYSRQRNSDFHNTFISTGKTELLNIYKAIKVWQNSTKKAEKNKEILAEYLDYVVKIFTGLNDIVIKEDENKSIYFDFKGIEYPSYGLIILENHELYYLFDCENIDTSKVRLIYKRFGNDNAIYDIEMSSKDFNKQMQKRPNKNSKNILIKNTFPKEYGYLNNLTLAIADIITDFTKEELFIKYREEYPYIFSMDDSVNVKEVDFEKANISNWDEVISMLILEISPTDFLMNILKGDGNYFRALTEGLATRYGNDELVNKIQSNMKKYEKEVRLMAESFDESLKNDMNIYNEIKQKCMIKSIMEGLSSIENISDVSYNCDFIGTLDMFKEHIELLKKSKEKVTGKVLEINKLVEKTLRYVLCFYKGMVAYGEAKQNILNDRKIDEDVDLNKDYLICERAFFDEADKTIKTCKSHSFGKLVGDIRDFSKELYENNNGKINVTEKGKILNLLIGRNNLFNLDAFEKIISFSGDEIIKAEDKKDITDIILFMNIAKHDKPEYPSLTESGFKIFIKHIIMLLEFLMYNDEASEDDKNNIPRNPIYPYVVSYSLSIKNRDGIKIPKFSVVLNNRYGDSIEKKILSGVDYDIKDKYYCLPNSSTSNEYWWIEPFLISATKFDRIMRDNPTINVVDEE